MRPMRIERAFTLIEPGPVVLVTTRDGGRDNVMTISWTMVVDFTPVLNCRNQTPYSASDIYIIIKFGEMR